MSRIGFGSVEYSVWMLYWYLKKELWSIIFYPKWKCKGFLGALSMNYLAWTSLFIVLFFSSLRLGVCVLLCWPFSYYRGAFLSLPSSSVQLFLNISIIFFHNIFLVDVLFLKKMVWEFYTAGLFAENGLLLFYQPERVDGATAPSSSSVATATRDTSPGVPRTLLPCISGSGATAQCRRSRVFVFLNHITDQWIQKARSYKL